MTLIGPIFADKAIKSALIRRIRVIRVLFKNIKFISQNYLTVLLKTNTVASACVFKPVNHFLYRVCAPQKGKRVKA